MEKMNDILVKVAILFRKYGIKSITMDDISREVGISKKTLYQFVTEKADLVNKVLESERERTKECFEKVRARGKNAISDCRFEIADWEPRPERRVFWTELVVTAEELS